MTIEQKAKRAADNIAFGLAELAKAQAGPQTATEAWRDDRYRQAAGMIRNGLEDALELLMLGRGVN